MRRNSFLQQKKDLRIYYNLNEFYDDFAGFADLVLSNFQTLLVGYFLACSAIFAVYFLHICFRCFRSAVKLFFLVLKKFL